MNWILLTASVIALATTLIHAILGGKDVAAPLLRAEIPEEVKLTMYACWHMVTAAMGLTSVALLLVATAVV
jgi:hypothetical protein